MNKEKFERTLNELIPHHVLTEEMSYCLEGGKRLRPLLTLAVVETFDESIEKALWPACSLEMIHTYSLIHDDLPCMDDDDFRRSKPTLHKAFSESHAVLTGDLLLTLAFEVLANAPHLTDKEKTLLISTLAKRAGGSGMIGGQILDIDAESQGVNFLEVYEKKTGALITAALEFGAILSEQDVGPFQTLGTHLGLAFQVIDDLLDEDGIVNVLGVEKARELADEHAQKAFDVLKRLPRIAPVLEELFQEMIFSRY